MTRIEKSDDRREILRTLGAYHAAMVGARIDALENILDKEFSLVHLTGYVQPKSEWFSVMRTGAFDYHAIDIDDRSLVLQLSESTAVLNGRGIFSATINGMNNPWKLQFKMTFSKHNGAWIITGAHYSSF